MEPEIAALSLLKYDFHGKKILDIGVGQGRTTPALTQLSNDYLGIDYSPVMISECRRRFPDMSFAIYDVRDLSEIADEQFDLIMFSYNGIDYMSHDDRLKALFEIRRIMSAQGVFIFSSHNRNYNLINSPFSSSNINMTINPLRFAIRLFRYCRGIANALALHRHQQHHQDYEILNDEASEYQLLTYYVTIEGQLRQLRRIGFTDIRVINLAGKELTEAEFVNETSRHIHYVCRKSAS